MLLLTVSILFFTSWWLLSEANECLWECIRGRFQPRSYIPLCLTNILSSRNLFQYLHMWRAEIRPNTNKRSPHRMRCGSRRWNKPEKRSHRLEMKKIRKPHQIRSPSVLRIKRRYTIYELAGFMVSIKYEELGMTKCYIFQIIWWCTIKTIFALLCTARKSAVEWIYLGI